MIYHCCDNNRRASVDQHATLNGIDFLEVLDIDAPAGSPRQQTLMVRLLKPVPAGLTTHNVRIEGGERIRRIGVEWVAIASAPPPPPLTLDSEVSFFVGLPEAQNILLIRSDSAGDFSNYQLHLEQTSGSGTPLVDFDPRLSIVEFAFKVECPSDFDCKPFNECPPALSADVDLNYLARDYESLRRLVMDRLSRQMPGWRDRSPADLATTLGELIAYVGDLQHYHLDAIGTESYLHTARRRSSLRHLGKLVDYAMHEGSNARTWLHVAVEGATFQLPAEARFLTRVAGISPRIDVDSTEERVALESKPLIFEAMHRPILNPDNNDFRFYSWGDERCCLPTGATAATLTGHWPDLKVGDVLIFKEILGPATGLPEDSDPDHRHVVRLTWVRSEEAGNPLTDPLDNTEITEIRWHEQDALPFPLCLSSETDAEHDSLPVADVSIALGNIVLVDHGVRISNEFVGEVPAPRLHLPVVTSDSCARISPEPIPPRFLPLLDATPVTYQGWQQKTVEEGGVRRISSVLFDPGASARSARQWHTADALPNITLQSTQGTSVRTWTARRDLLDSKPDDTHFVLVVETDGGTRVRFGNDANGRRPETGTTFNASYRIGNGPQGNVGADTITHVVTNDDRIINVTNPLSAVGGVAPETPEEVRRHAPHAFRIQERAVTPADYADVTERLASVDQATADLRWTGSWHSVFVTIDREGGEPINEEFSDIALAHLERYRMAGHDVRIKDPVHVSLEIDLLVCVNPVSFRSDVRIGLLDVLGSQQRIDRSLGLFHPDNFSFGETVYLSPLYEAARSVAGVDSVEVTRFQRQGTPDPKPLADGFMQLADLEIARLDNNRNFPENGVLRLDLRGGK